MQPKTGQLLLGKLARVNGNSEAVFCSLSSLLSLCAGIGSVGVRARAQREGAVEVACTDRAATERLAIREITIMLSSQNTTE